MWTLYIKKKQRYDYSLKSKEDRGKFIEDKLGFILDATPDLLMGYSGKGRIDDNKIDRIPKMIDAYTTYFLESRDTGVEKTEYTFFLNQRDEKRRKTNEKINNVGYSIDNTKNEEDSYSGESSSSNEYDTVVFRNNMEGLAEEENIYVDIEVLKYAIKKGEFGKDDYRKILSMSADIIAKSKDEEFVNMIQQIVFNCTINAKDEKDRDILKMNIEGVPAREIARELGISAPTIKNRIDKMLSWV